MKHLTHGTHARVFYSLILLLTFLLVGCAPKYNPMYLIEDQSVPLGTSEDEVPHTACDGLLQYKNPEPVKIGTTEATAYYNFLDGKLNMIIYECADSGAMEHFYTDNYGDLPDYTGDALRDVEDAKVLNDWVIYWYTDSGKTRLIFNSDL